MTVFNKGLGIILILFLFACSKSELTLKEYFLWQEDETNGLHKLRRVGDLEFDLKFLSPEYLTYLELNGMKHVTQEMKDSIKKMYENNLTFLLTIGPAKDVAKKFDITSVGVADYDEYSNRMNLLNFGLPEMLEIKLKDKSIHPVLVEMENTYGLAFHRKFNIVFAPQKDKKELLDLKKIKMVLNDEIFNTGSTSFGFLKEDIENTPKLIY